MNYAFVDSDNETKKAPAPFGPDNDDSDDDRQLPKPAEPEPGTIQSSDDDRPIDSRYGNQ